MTLLARKRKIVRKGLVAEYRFDECKNLLRYSQQFDNAAWTSGAGVTVTPNAVADPNGNVTADNWTSTGTTNADASSTYQTKTTASTLGACVGSVWMTATVAQTVQIWLADTRTGVATTNCYVTNTWQRFTVNGTFTTTTQRLYISPIDAAATNIRLGGAQLEQGSQCTPYYPTLDKQYLMDYSRPRINLLLPNQANACEDGTTTGFSNLGANTIISAEPTATTLAWQGAYSLKVVTHNDSDTEGAQIPRGQLYKPNTKYTFSANLKGSGTVVLVILEYKDDMTSLISYTVGETITLTETWTRYTVSRTYGVTGRGMLIYISTPTRQAATFYVDGLQLEEGSVASAWQAPPNIGILGANTTSTGDANDPTWTGTGLTFGADDYVNCGGVYNSAGTLQNGNTISIVFYATAAYDKTTTKLCLASLGTAKAVYIGDTTDATITNEIITIQYSAGVFTAWCDAALTIPIGWHVLDLVWNGTTYEIWLDGVQKPGTDVGVPSLLSLSAVKLRYDGTTYGSGLSGAYSLKYNRQLAVSERAQNRAYLKSYLLANRAVTVL